LGFLPIGLQLNKDQRSMIYGKNKTMVKGPWSKANNFTEGRRQPSQVPENLFRGLLAPAKSRIYGGLVVKVQQYLHLFKDLLALAKAQKVLN
jgi:hypothetical protein